jgi:hypothetical protein
MEENFTHNFCESRLTNNAPPEIFNSYTSLFITIIPLLMGFPKNIIFYNVACMLAFNGIASFYYHYTLSWLGKQTDEVSMILATYFGIWGLLKMYYNKNITKLNWYNGWNGMFMIMFITMNTIIKNDYLFPPLFTCYIGIVLFLIHTVSLQHNISYQKYLLLSFIGAKCWIISEIYCTEYTKYGHVVWHLLFPLGFYKLILVYDDILYIYDYNQIEL